MVSLCLYAFLIIAVISLIENLFVKIKMFNTVALLLLLHQMLLSLGKDEVII